MVSRFHIRKKKLKNNESVSSNLFTIKNNYIQIIRNEWFKPFFFLIIAIIVATILSPDFIKIENIRAVFISAAPLMLLAVGEALIVLTGMIDLSPESVLASSGVVMASLDIIIGLPTVLSVLITLLYGALIGLVSGLLVAKARIPSFVVTLGLYWGLRGLAMVITDGYPVSPNYVSPPKPFTFSWISDNIYGVPVMVIIAILIGVIVQIYVSHFKRGIDIYAVGGNELAARNCGINTVSTKIFVFVISGILGSLAGIMMTAWVNQAYAWTAQGFTLQTVAAVVIGGIPFVGGYGTIVGVLIGSFVIAMISDIIVLLGVSPMYNYIAVAIVLIVAGLQVRGKGFAK